MYTTIKETIKETKHNEVAQKQKALPIELIEHVIVEQEQEQRPVRERLLTGNAQRLTLLPQITLPEEQESQEEALAHQLSDTTEQGGVCVVVPTDETFLQGSEATLHSVKEQSNLSVIQRDYIVERYQIFEARAMGADALILMPALLERDGVYELLSCAYELGVEVLVEIASIEDCEKIVGLPFQMIGIRKHGLAGSVMSDEEIDWLAECIPDDITVVRLS